MNTHIKSEPLETLKGAEKQKIIPFLWFNDQAEEAAKFYVSVFKNARVKTTSYYSLEGAAATGRPKGSVMTVDFQIEGMNFTAINGGSAFKISPAISFMVSCRTHEKVNDLWAKLSDGGKVMMEIGQYHFSELYGWIEDKYGVSWQINLGNDSQILAPCLLFTGEQRGKAEEAINYYMSVFKNSAVEVISRYSKEDEGPTGAVNYAAFSLDGQNFKAMDSGIEVPFQFTPGLSLLVNCETQQEIDYFWERLSLDGDENAQQCGWLADRYGVSWQVVPEALGIMMTDSNSEKTRRVMNALFPMKKLILSELKTAFEGPGEETGANYEGPEYAYRKIDTLTPNEEL